MCPQHSIYQGFPTSAVPQSPTTCTHPLSAENHHRRNRMPLSDQVHIRFLVAQYVIYYDGLPVTDVPKGKYNQVCFGSIFTPADDQ